MEVKQEKKKKLIAKKDWHIVQNEIDIKIIKGEEIPKLSKNLMEALKIEKVI